MLTRIDGFSFDSINADRRGLICEGLALQPSGAKAPILGPVSVMLPVTGCTVILGANGAGKSAFLKLVHGLVEPTAGRALWGGVPAGPETRVSQAMVFQKPVLLRRSALANVRYVLPKRADKTRCLELLERAGLADKANVAARVLSGGEQQRLALVRALATDPDVLLLDEPMASLDPASVLIIEGILAEQKARGCKVILVTHDMAQAQRLADDVVFLHRGQLVEQATAETFFIQPSSRAAQLYLSGVPMV